MEQLQQILKQTISLFVFIPLLAFFSLTFLQNKQERPVARIVLLTKIIYILLSVAFAGAWLIAGREALSIRFATLYKTEHFIFAIQFYYDEVTAVFSVVGSLVFFLVSTFSRYYMHRDEGFKRFFHIILLFAAGYNLIIFSGNFETMFIGWEIKGLCSFLLIAFYRTRYLPVKNAYKTISNYRISDIALMLAMWMMHHLTHQNISFTQLGEAGKAATQAGYHSMAVFIVLMLILAAIVKSAQFPFTSWLPRAMEGPTSSSAIFYGSLSVHVGVFLLLRTYPFWQEMEWVKIVVIVAGALTGIIATLIARVQPTVKTQIAYASAAQIGIIFIEIALGFHWLALVHFAGNAFLRTYQLLVSPSVLNYLVHHQYFHYHPPQQKPVGRLQASLYMLGIKEWGMDTFMYKYIWSPFKWLGRKMQFIEKFRSDVSFFLVVTLFGVKYFLKTEFSEGLETAISAFLLLLALFFILFSFSSRGNAKTAWGQLFNAHLLIILALGINKFEGAESQSPGTEILFYFLGVLVAFVTGYFCLQKIQKIDKDISLNCYHGYVYEQKNTALLFLVSAIAMLGFPITTAFIGIDVFFTYINSGQWVLITLLALCFLFVELAAIRIYLRIFCGPHKKLYHPVAFRSS